MAFERITSDHRVMAGVPCIRGTRIPVATVVGLVAEGVTIEEILADYPQLAREDVEEALRYAAAAVDQGTLPFQTCVKFLIDESLQRRLVDLLSEAGHEALHVADLWAVTAGSAGVFFSAVGDHDLPLPPWMEEITARLPGGGEVRPTRIDSGVAFDPQLPDGTLVLIGEEPFHTVEIPGPTTEAGRNLLRNPKGVGSTRTPLPCRPNSPRRARG